MSDVQALKKHIKRALRTRGLVVTSGPYSGIDPNNAASAEAVKEAIKTFCENEVKRTLLQKCRKHTNQVFKFYAQRIRSELSSGGTAYIAYFKSSDFTLKSDGLWTMQVCISKNCWRESDDDVSFEATVGIPTRGEVIVSEIPERAIDLLVSIQKKISEEQTVAKSVDNFLENSGFVGSNRSGIEASVKIKDMLE
jgi:hypothetical protein